MAGPEADLSWGRVQNAAEVSHIEATEPACATGRDGPMLDPA
jgi:hypothetical protein